MDVRQGQGPVVVVPLPIEMAVISSNALIVFQKNSVLGKVKTRIAASMGEERALQIYKFLIQKTYAAISEANSMDVLVFFSDDIEKIPSTFFKNPYQAFLQNGENLGERMKNAFQEVFKLGYKKAVIIGTDCPELSAEIINNSFSILKNSLVVFGPSTDGGYYLLGMKRLIEELFTEIPWSTNEVLTLSLKKLKEKKIEAQFLPVLADIDTEEDWNLYNT